MKVSELIARLQKMPQDKDVAIDAADYYGDTDTVLVGDVTNWVNCGKDKAGYVFISPSDTTVGGEKVSDL
jgi:hypothetical protein